MTENSSNRYYRMKYKNKTSWKVDLWLKHINVWKSKKLLIFCNIIQIFYFIDFWRIKNIKVWNCKLII